MKKKSYLMSIEYMRGIAMAGVVAIHVCSQYLLNPTPNIFLVALMEIVTRFSIPIFFFLSAFGLFYKINLNEPFDYKKFLQRRLKAVLVPYLLWSFFYIFHDYWGIFLEPSYIFRLIFFGLAKYQLYFMVILIWFYFFMPVWIKIIKILTPIKFAVIFFLQIAFNYFSSFSADLFFFTQSLPDDSFLKLLLVWRLNWLILHYIFIFLLGGILAVHWQKFFDFMSANKKIITAIFLFTMIILVGWFIFLVRVENYSPIAAINTAHQLSPLGFLYSIAASIFLFMFFEFVYNGKFKFLLSLFGKNSFFIYLFHPFAITYLMIVVEKFGLIMTAPVTIIFYVLVMLISLAFGEFWRKFSVG